MFKSKESKVNYDSEAQAGFDEQLNQTLEVEFAGTGDSDRDLSLFS